MHHEIKVVRIGEKPFFEHRSSETEDALSFDTLFVQLFNWEPEQDIRVRKADGDEETIAFADTLSPEPLWVFRHKSTTTSCLHSYQFQVGDALTMVVRDNGGCKNLAALIRACWIRYSIATSLQLRDPKYARLSREEQGAIVAELRKLKTQEAQAGSPLVFRPESDKPIMWR